MKIRIKDNSMPSVGFMRKMFEEIVHETPLLKSKVKLSAVETNGKLSHYEDHETDILWVGFALGLRAARRFGN